MLCWGNMFPPVLAYIFPTVLLHAVFSLKQAVRTDYGPAAGPKTKPVTTDAERLYTEISPAKISRHFPTGTDPIYRPAWMEKPLGQHADLLNPFGLAEMPIARPDHSAKISFSINVQVYFSVMQG